MRARLALALVASIAALALVAEPVGAAVLWTLVGTPLTATTGQSTTFQLTATNLDLANDIGCIRVGVTSQFAVEGTSIVSVSSGRTWTSSSGGSTVTARSIDGGGRLNLLASVVFSVRARPLAPGAWTWSGTAYEGQDCSSPLPLGIQLTAIVVTGAAATPVPTPSPVPSTSPTPAPTPRPTPTPILSVPSLPVPSLPLPSIAVPSTSIPPLPIPSLGPIAPFPTLAVPSLTSRPTLSPGPSATVNSASPTPSTAQPTATPSLSSAVIARGGNGAGGGSAGDPTSAGPLPVAIGPGGVGVRWSPSGDNADLGALSLDGLELGQLWLVPAALVGTSGLLVILWVVLQLVAGAIWLPAARRLRGEDWPRAQIIVRV